MPALHTDKSEGHPVPGEGPSPRGPCKAVVVALTATRFSPSRPYPRRSLWGPWVVSAVRETLSSRGTVSSMSRASGVPLTDASCRGQNLRGGGPRSATGCVSLAVSPVRAPARPCVNKDGGTLAVLQRPAAGRASNAPVVPLPASGRRSAVSPLCRSIDGHREAQEPSPETGGGGRGVPGAGRRARGFISLSICKMGTQSDLPGWWDNKSCFRSLCRDPSQGRGQEPNPLTGAEAHPKVWGPALALNSHPDPPPSASSSVAPACLKSNSADLPQPHRPPKQVPPTLWTQRVPGAGVTRTKAWQRADGVSTRPSPRPCEVAAEKPAEEAELARLEGLPAEGRPVPWLPQQNPRGFPEKPCIAFPWVALLSFLKDGMARGHPTAPKVCK